VIRLALVSKADTDFNPPFATDLFLLALRSFSEGGWTRSC